MKIEAVVNDGIKYITIKEIRIDSHIANDFKEYLSSELEGATKIILDCNTLEFIDSSGLSALVFFYKTGDKQGAQIKLINVTDKVLSILQMTGLTKIFEIYSDLDVAKKSF